MGRRRAFVRSIKRAGRRGVPFTRLFGSTVGMGLALAATSAWAQTPPAESKDSKDDVSLPGVDVRGQRNQFKIEEPSLYKLPDSIKDTPQSITVLPEQILEERALFTLRDALRTVPGISLAAGEGGGRQGDNLTLRGFPAGNDIYIDGVRDLGQYGARHVQPGVGRGPEGPLRGPVRPRLDRRHHQPGLQVAEAHPVLRVQRHGGQRARRGASRWTSTSRSAARAPCRLNLMGFKGETVGREYVDQQRLGAAPSVRHRPQRPDPLHRRATTTSTTTTSPTTASRTCSASRSRWTGR